MVALIGVGEKGEANTDNQIYKFELNCNGEKRENKHLNPKPFLPDGDDFYGSKKRYKHDKEHQKQVELIAPATSSRILNEALIQKREIETELEAQNQNCLVVCEELETTTTEEEIDAFAGFFETQNHSEFVEDEIDEKDLKLLEAFFESKDSGPQETIADVISRKIKEKYAHGSSERQQVPKFDSAIIDLYKGAGGLLSRYTSGKIPKAVKHIPALGSWEEVLRLTEPDNWSPNAVYQVTRIFAANFDTAKARRFYKFVLLPHVREDIRKNKRLHFALYQTLKKSLFKPAAFFTGILIPLCESGTCSLREAVIIGSIIQKCSIPVSHSSAALIKLLEKEYSGTTSYFIKLLIEKKYALPVRVIGSLVSHFMRFIDDSRSMPVIWHQSLLAFAQRYKTCLGGDEKMKLGLLTRKQWHKLVTPEINRELMEEELAPTSSFVINKAIEEDRFDLPAVPMEDD